MPTHVTVSCLKPSVSSSARKNLSRHDQLSSTVTSLVVRVLICTATMSYKPFLVNLTPSGKATNLSSRPATATNKNFTPSRTMLIFWLSRTMTFRRSLMNLWWQMTLSGRALIAKDASMEWKIILCTRKQSQGWTWRSPARPTGHAADLPWELELFQCTTRRPIPSQLSIWAITTIDSQMLQLTKWPSKITRTARPQCRKSAASNCKKTLLESVMSKHMLKMCAAEATAERKAAVHQSALGIVLETVLL